jgi:hypothetical protein
MTDELTPEQNQRAYELNLRAAERAHEQNAAYVAIMSDTVMKDAWAVMRILVLINGGAAIAILTFVGGLAAKSDRNVAQVVGVANGLRWFAYGVIAATLIAGFSYLTNYCYGLAATVAIKDWVHPYVHPTPFGNKVSLAGRVLHVAAIALALASLGLFAAGVYSVSNAVAQLG